MVIIRFVGIFQHFFVLRHVLIKLFIYVFVYLNRSQYNGAIVGCIIHCANTTTVRYQGKALTDASRKRKTLKNQTHQTQKHIISSDNTDNQTNQIFPIVS